MKKIDFYKSFKFLVPYLFNNRYRFYVSILTIIIIFIGTLATVYLPLISGKVVLFFSERNLQSLTFYLSLLSLCWFFESSYINIASISLFKTTNYIIKELRLQVLLKLDQIPLNCASKYTKSEIIYCNERVPSAVVGFLNNLILTLLPSFINSVVIGIIFYNNYKFGSILIISLFLSYIPVSYLFKKYSLSRVDVWKKGDDLRIVQNEFLLNKDISNIRLEVWQKRLGKYFDEEANSWDINNTIFYSIPIVIDFFQYFIFYVFLFYTIFKNVQNIESSSKLVEIFGFVVVFTKNFSNFASSLRVMYSSSIDLAKIHEIFSLKNSVPLNIMLKKENPKYIYDFKNVHVKINSFLILKNANFSIKRGEKIAIIGDSGVGKSSICKILAGKNFDFEGFMNFFDIDIKSISREEIKNRVSYLTQDMVLMNGSVKDNLYSGKVPPPEEIVQYFEDKNLLEKQISEYGRNLSNGERQRLLIASAISSGTNLLIIDEIFNSLDNNSALELLNICLKEVETVICVTHQTFLLSNFDRIFSIENRSIIERYRDEI